MRRRAALVLACGVAACSLPSADGYVADYHEDGSEPTGAVTSALNDTDPVSAAVTDTGCSTTIVKGLATQLVEQIQCLRPGTFTTIESDPGLSLGSAVFPWLQTPARAAVLAAQKDRGVTLTINSALRTLPQQYLLYNWYKKGRCGISLAAAPGKSNHEAGLAVDVADNASWRDAMKAHDMVWLGTSDPVHFDYKGDGAADIGGLSVLAFQKLWNLNHPEDKLDENSTYDATVEDRLAKSPVGGFAKGPVCTPDAGTAPPPPVADAGDDASAAGPTGQRTGDGSGGCICNLAPRRSGGGWALSLAAGALALLRVRRRRR